MKYPDDYIDKIICGDCLEVMKDIPNNSIDVIITDPPYKKEFEHLYEKMAIEAKRILRIGGSLLTLCGHYQLARVLPDMAKHLKYRWIIKLDHPGAHARMLMGIEVTWKPMLWLVNEKFSPSRNVVDSVISGKRSKSNHPWEQDEDYARWGIEYLTDENHIVLDPFVGSGTTCVACAKTNRHYIGIEKEEKYCEIARQRIGI